MYIYANRNAVHYRSLITTAVIGASGYSGAELLRLLLQRTDVSVRHAFAASSAGKRVSDVHPVFKGVTDLFYESLEAMEIPDVDVAFLALPSGEAMHMVPRLVPHARKIIDLGGDFRLSSPALYEEFYHRPHAAPGYLCEAVYGLPELNKAKLPSARLIANPGCYPTSAILALLPALMKSIISPTGIVINSLSGVTGAGRTSSVEYSFSEINENIRAYTIGLHQHLPEIRTILEQACGRHVSLSFVPHLVPMNRGIYSTIHADLEEETTEREIRELYAAFYAADPFVRIREQAPQIKDVVRTNYCDIGINIEPRTRQLILTSAIDNLLKGAAGQAVQNLNIIHHLPQQLGLL